MTVVSNEMVARARSARNAFSFPNRSAPRQSPNTDREFQKQYKVRREDKRAWFRATLEAAFGQPVTDKMVQAAIVAHHDFYVKRENTQVTRPRGEPRFSLVTREAMMTRINEDSVAAMRVTLEAAWKVRGTNSGGNRPDRRH